MTWHVTVLCIACGVNLTANNETSWLLSLLVKMLIKTSQVFCNLIEPHHFMRLHKLTSNKHLKEMNGYVGMEVVKKDRNKIISVSTAYFSQLPVYTTAIPTFPCNVLLLIVYFIFTVMVSQNIVSLRYFVRMTFVLENCVNSIVYDLLHLGHFAAH